MSAGTLVERGLARAVDLRPGEAPGLAAAFAYHFLLFTAYYILRPIRDSMGVTGGVENIDDLFGWTLLGMLLAVPVFGWLSGRFRRGVFLPWTYVFFAAQLVAFWAVFTAHEDDAATARVFFVWVSVFNLFVISVFWSFMADLFDKEQGKRLFAFITAGASVGAISGSAITKFFAESVGNVNLLLVSAVMLASTVLLMRYLLGWSRGRDAGARAHRGAADRRQSLRGTQARAVLALPRRHRGLRIPDGRGQHLSVPAAGGTPRDPLPGRGRADGISRPNRARDERHHAGAAALRGRPADEAGRRRTMIVIVPLFVVAGFLLIAVSPTLATLVGVFIARRVGQYAIVRPCREMLYTTVDRESKYKAKNVNDTLVYRTSDYVVAKGHDAIVSAWSASLSGIALVGAGVAALWALVAFALGRAHERMSAARGRHLSAGTER